MGDSAGAPALADTDEEPFLDAAWTEAIEATELLRTVLSDLGLADGFPRLRGDVNVYGRPDAARRLAAVLSLVLDERRRPRREYRGAETRGAAVGAEPEDLPPPVACEVVAAARPESLPPATSSEAVPLESRVYSGPGSTCATDDLQASALRLMRLYNGPAIPAPAAEMETMSSPPIPAPACAEDRDDLASAQTVRIFGQPTAQQDPLAGPPAAAARPLREQRGLPLRADVAELHEVRGDPERLPA